MARKGRTSALPSSKYQSTTPKPCCFAEGTFHTARSYAINHLLAFSHPLAQASQSIPLLTHRPSSALTEKLFSSIKQSGQRQVYTLVNPLSLGLTRQGRPRCWQSAPVANEWSFSRPFFRLPTVKMSKRKVPEDIAEEIINNATGAYTPDAASVHKRGMARIENNSDVKTVQTSSQSSSSAPWLSFKEQDDVYVKNQTESVGTLLKWHAFRGYNVYKNLDYTQKMAVW